MGQDRFSRRSVLGGLASFATGSFATQGGLPRPAAWAIDVHHHFLPPDYARLASAWLTGIEANSPAVGAWSPARSLAAMDAGRIDHAVLSLSAPGVSFAGGGNARALARHCNDYATALAREHPGRFSFFAALAMPNVEESIAEAERALALPGCRGLGLLSSYDGHYLGAAQFRPLFDWAERRGRPLIYVHPTVAACCLNLSDIPTPLIEFPVDTARTISSLLWAGLLNAEKGLRFIFSHGGGALPMLLQRVAAAGMQRPELAKRVPEGPASALSRIWVDSASVLTAPAMAAVDRWLPEANLLFGTDYPWGDPARARDELRRLDLSPHRLAGIERLNAVAIGIGD